MSDWLHRERMLLGDDAVENLKNKKIMIFGIGGVGSYALEAVVRAGVGAVALVDSDTVSETNINRQLIADTTTVGRLKTEVAEERCKKINPKANFGVYFIYSPLTASDTPLLQAHPQWPMPPQ